MFRRHFYILRGCEPLSVASYPKVFCWSECVAQLLQTSIITRYIQVFAMIATSLLCPWDCPKTTQKITKAMKNKYIDQTYHFFKTSHTTTSLSVFQDIYYTRKTLANNAKHFIINILYKNIQKQSIIKYDEMKCQSNCKNDLLICENKNH